MASKHTPGPWRVGDAGHAVFGPPDSGMYPNTPITIVQRVVNPANARLIAAAPELLEALQDLVSQVQSLGIAARLELDQVENALDKAGIE